MRVCCAVTVAAALLLTAELRAQSTLEVFSVDPSTLIKVRESLHAGTSLYQPALKRLLRDAEKALDVEPMSVVDKEKTPPSGNKHDYMSLGRYWWPDPSKPDGLPYIRKDGETNPEIGDYRDHEKFTTICNNAFTLGLAYFFTGRKEFAHHACGLVRTWFLDSTTAMTPHLDYSQSIPGRSTGRGTGVLDGRHTALVIDAIGLMRASGEWSDADDAALRAWFGRYTDWLVTSKNGMDEAAAENNHGTWYDAHVLPSALYSGRKDIALKIAREVPAKRIFAQIRADGTQPEELARTRSWHYSIFNLEAFVRLSIQTKRLGVDLWSAKGPDGQSLRAAIDALLPYARKEREWTYKEIEGVDRVGMSPLLLGVYLVTLDTTYRDLAFTLGGSRLAEHRSVLLTGAEPKVKQ